MTTPARYFERIHRSDDPFGYRTRWYEQRKRMLLLGVLPQQRFDTAWEIGCSNGELTSALADRCNQLLATDVSLAAVALARARTSALAHVHVRKASHPEAWAAGEFDLIVLSEVGYYFDAKDMRTVAVRIAASRTSQGVVVACHWLHPFAEACSSAISVHDTLAGVLGAPQMKYEDADFRLEVWDAAPCSVAQREGLR